MAKPGQRLGNVAMRPLNSIMPGMGPSPSAPALSDVISTIGGDGFDAKLVNYLADMCGAEHCAVFTWDKGRLRNVASASLDGTDTAHRQASIYIDSQYWKRDPLIAEAHQSVGQEDSCVYKTDVRGLNDPGLRDVVYGRPHIRERLLLCGGVRPNIFVLSILRSESKGLFSEDDLDRLRGMRTVLLSLLGRHIELIARSAGLATALTSLREIEACIAVAPERFPRREAEVTARILYGISTLGISLDLSISEETVMTYRKRAYLRLGIGTQRELLLWFIALWCSPRHLALETRSRLQ